MPKRCGGMTKSDTEATLLKYVDADMPRQQEGSISSSSPSDTSSNSLFSSNRSEFSERTSSPVPPECRPSRDVRHRQNQTACAPRSHRTVRAHNSTSRSRSEDRQRTPRPSPFLQRRCLVVMTIISVTFSIVTCCFVALCFVFKFGPALEDNTFQDGDYEACVPSRQLSHHRDQSVALRDLFTVKVFPDNLEYYCARNTGQMSSLIQIIMNQRRNTAEKPQPTKHKVRSTPVSAHRYLLPWSSSPSLDESKCETKLCHLKLDNYSKTSRQHHRFVSVHENHMEITYSGWYFIYSSIYIRPKNDIPCSQLLKQNFQHFITRTRSNSSNHSSCLVESAHTCCDDCMEDHHTSYAAGVFELRERDQISVSVSGSNRVLFEGNGTYLGLVMLSSLNTSTEE